MKRIHYSATDDVLFQNVDQVQSCLGKVPLFKPYGLWYSIDDAWEQWIEREMPRWGPSCQYEYELDLDMDKVLVVEPTASALEKFLEQYGHTITILSSIELLSHIDWPAIAKDYAGVEFNPYSKEAFYSGSIKRSWLSALSFYSGLDVPSGCIWDKSAILNMQLVK